MPPATDCSKPSRSKGCTPSSISACVTAAPMRSWSPSAVTCRSSPSAETSTTCFGRARRRFSIGPRYWPPPITLAAPPASASARKAAGSVAGRWYSKLAAFIGCSSCDLLVLDDLRRLDRLEQAARGQRGLRHFGAQRAQRIVHRVEDGRRRRDRTALAHALGAELGVRRRGFEVVDAHGGHLGRARQHVVGQGGGERLAVAVVGRLLVERGADALRHAA